MISVLSQGESAYPRLQAVQAVYNFLVAKAGLEQTLGYDFTQE